MTHATNSNECCTTTQQKNGNKINGNGVDHVNTSHLQNCTGGIDLDVKDDSEKDEYHITGVIDFGDVSFSCHLYEVAIAMSYVIINKYGLPLFDAGGCVLVSYLKHIQLSEFELEQLKVCVCTRLSQSIVMGLITLKANPDNIYNLKHSSRMWEPLEKIWPMDKHDFCQSMLMAGNNGN